jgi:midasin
MLITAPFSQCAVIFCPRRFLELSICDLPLPEIEDIVTHACGIPPKFSKMLVKTMNEVQLRRHQTNIFQGKYGVVTTRDIIKWGNRRPQTALEVAAEGYMLLAEKLREDTQRVDVLSIINDACQTKLDPSTLYDIPSFTISGDRNSSVEGRDLLELVALQGRLRARSVNIAGVSGIAVTKTLKRLWKLIGRCVANNEPALLIGGTGSGKTTVCQLVAANRGQTLRILNCHQSTETADIIGGLRPVRGRPGILRNLCMTSCPAYIERLETFVREAANTILPELDSVMSALSSTIAESKQLQLEAAASLVDLHDAAPLGGEDRIVDEDVVKRLVDSLTCTGSYLEQIRSFLLIKKPSLDPKDNLLSNKKLRKIQPLSAGNGTDNVLTEIVDRLSSDLNQFVRTGWSRYRSLFEWHDGPLVQAMKAGDIFLLDEINLAEDAVIERLNSVLESGRSLTLAERGADSESERIIAHPDFKFLATMNPGGDFGKKELSPALRSRFTESFVQEMLNEEDVVLILFEILSVSKYFSDAGHGANVGSAVAVVMYQFMKWLNERAGPGTTNVNIIISVREILAWATFVSNWMKAKSLRISSEGSRQKELECQVYAGMLHGAFMVLLDGMGIGSSADRDTIRSLKENCHRHLLSQCPTDMVANLLREIAPPAAETAIRVSTCSHDSASAGVFQLAAFEICLGPYHAKSDQRTVDFVVDSENTKVNLWRVMRAMQVDRPILLEGPPVS